MLNALGRTLLLAAAITVCAPAYSAPPVPPATTQSDALTRAKTAWTLLEHNAHNQLPGTLLVEPTRAVEAHLTLTAEVPELTPTSWIAYAAVPPNLATQHVTLFDISPKSMQLADARLPARRFLIAIASAGADPHKFQISATYQLQLFKRTFIAGTFKSQTPAAVPKSQATDLASALLPTETLDFDTPAFQTALDQSDLRPHRDETELDFARRAFVTLKSRLHYKYSADLDRRSSAVWQSATSDCGGLNGLFVSVLRANGIPARTLCGRWAKSASDADTLNGLPYAQWHVKAEFFLPKVGWIPVDLSGAVQCAPATDTGLAYFGSDHGDFITMHTDFDLVLDALQFGRQRIIADQGFAYWVSGAGSMNGHSSHESWQVAEPSRASANSN